MNYIVINSDIHKKNENDLDQLNDQIHFTKKLVRNECTYLMICISFLTGDLVSSMRGIWSIELYGEKPHLSLSSDDKNVTQVFEPRF